MCALCESVLRAHGLKTGFYRLPLHKKLETFVTFSYFSSSDSSPHLLEVRERIRINGHPLTKHQFVEHFWDCYKKLDQTKVHQVSRTIFNAGSFLFSGTI